MAVRNSISGIERFPIGSEEDAWTFLERFQAAGYQDLHVLPSFKGWPTTEFKFWIGRQNAAVTAPVAEALLDYQNSINRLFMLLSEDSTNLRGLSEEERKRFEVVFKISKGSTGVGASLLAIAKEFTGVAINKMTGRQLTVIVVIIALLIAGDSYLRAWLENQKDITAAETSSNQVKEILATQHFAVEADLKKAELLHKTLDAAFGNRNMVEATEEGRKGLVKAASKVTDTTLAGKRLPPEVAKPMARTARAPSEISIITEQFEVVRVDTNVNDGFRVHLRRLSDDSVFFASVRDLVLSEKDRLLIAQGEWQKKPIEARVQITERRGVVTEARIAEVIGVIDHPTIASSE